MSVTTVLAFIILIRRTRIRFREIVSEMPATAKVILRATAMWMVQMLQLSSQTLDEVKYWIPVPREIHAMVIFYVTAMQMALMPPGSNQTLAGVK